MFGKIKFFSQKRGYGFIVGEDNRDYFFHVTSLDSNLRSEKETFIGSNDEVSFSVGPGNGGREQAIKIVKIP